jgi:hypothetical protein
LKDAYVAKINAAGSALIFATYLGGNADDVGSGIAVDGAGDVYVTGPTVSTDFPTSNPYQPAHASDSGASDIFVTKLNFSGSSLLFSTYLGGSQEESGFPSLALDADDNIYLAGLSASTDYPVQNNNAHAMPLYAALRMAGLRATGRGLVVAPKIPDHDFALKTTLVDVQRSETALRVRYTPRGPAARLVEISPPPGTIITAAFLDGGPRAIDSEELATFFVVGGDGTSFDFEVILSPIGSD